MSSTDDYVKNNEAFMARFDREIPPGPPTKRIAVVACMDARLHLAGALGIREGESHVIRNAGGIVTDDVIRSLMMSQRFLGTREIMLVHHTDCGMMRSSDAEVLEAIREQVGEVPPFPIGTFEDVDEDVRTSIARIKSSPFIRYTDAVRGFVYEVKTGGLREVR
jgi:carbonic anhydrase